MNKNTILPVLGYAVFYLLYTVIFGSINGQMVVDGNQVGASVGIGTFGVLFISGIFGGVVGAKVIGDHIPQENKIGIVLLSMLAAVFIEGVFAYTQDFFQYETGVTIFMGFIVALAAIGGFVILFGINIGNRIINGKLAEESES